MRTIFSSPYQTFSKFATYLPDGWEANESNRCYSGSRNIKAHTAAAATTTRWCGDEVTPKFCKLRLKLSKMIARGLILLGFRPSGMRTGQESVEEEGHTSGLWRGEGRENHGSREAYHLIFNFLCEEIRGLFGKRREGSILLFFVLWS